MMLFHGKQKFTYLDEYPFHFTRYSELPWKENKAMVSRGIATVYAKTHVRTNLNKKKLLRRSNVNLTLFNFGRSAVGITSEPRHEISYNVVCATSKATDQPAHMRSLIRAFANRLNIL